MGGNEMLVMSIARIIYAIAVVGLVIGLMRLGYFWLGRGSLPPIDATPDRALSFGYKCAWLAVPSDSVVPVCDALSQADPRFSTAIYQPCNWASGMGRVHANFRNSEVFITPPIKGWVLVYNWSPSDGDELGTFQRVLGALSARFGRAAAFGSYRGVGAVSWALADEGILQRAFAEVDGSTLVDFGEPMPVEQQLGLRTMAQIGELLDDHADTSQVDEDTLFDQLADESTVIHLAGRWSIDPSTLDTHEKLGVGRLARPSRR